MAHPQLADYATSTDNGTTHTVSMPSGTINAGELLVCLCGTDGDNSVTNWDTDYDWTEFLSGDDGNDIFFAAAWRKADGTESGQTFDVITANSEGSSWIVQRWTGAADPTVTPPEGTLTYGDSENPDPPSHNTGAGTQDYTWMPAGSADRRAFTGYPSLQYPDNQITEYGGGATDASVACCTGEITSQQQDPGTFTIASADEWMAATIVIFPSGAAPPDAMPMAESLNMMRRNA